MKTLRKHVVMLLLGLAATMVCGAQTKPSQIQITDGPIPVRVLLQGPADTDAGLQVICLFRSEPANGLHGALTEMNGKLKGLLARIRTPILFRGDLGETILIALDAGAIPAKKLMLIGLGDSQTFTPERMELVGSIAYREASRLGAIHLFFAPTVLDGGVTKYTTGQISEQVIRGVLRAMATEKTLKAANVWAGITVQDLTYLAGPQFASNTRDGIEKAFAAAK